jgi:hypothetical protein
LERVKRTLGTVLSLSWVVKGRGVLAAILMFTVILVTSGVVFVTLNRVATFWGRQIFAPTQTLQTVAEFIVVSLYYALGLTGLTLFYFAATGRLTDRAAGYAALGASLLILLSALGLFAGYTAKI